MMIVPDMCEWQTRSPRNKYTYREPMIWRSGRAGANAFYDVHAPHIINML